MASIFTFDPNPAEVSSPWLTPTDTPKPSTPQPNNDRHSTDSTPLPGHLTDSELTRLGPEPQEGSTEYKLHLLLRPQRKYASISTISIAPGSRHSKQLSSKQVISDDLELALAPSDEYRQHRLEKYANQMLWRLQQSSPYHSSSSNALVLPKLPKAGSILEAPPRPAKLAAGLEGSRGALYELGVLDDGTFHGLTEEDMEESLTNLRAMAASLGCIVKEEKRKEVGECEWLETVNMEVGGTKLPGQAVARSKSPLNPTSRLQTVRRRAKLYIVEARVEPDLSSRAILPSLESDVAAHRETPSPTSLNELSGEELEYPSVTTEQLRVTLAGPLASGKSTLLATLSSGTLDNGRGKIRPNIFNHRHEIKSGKTSSVAQQLIGYKDSQVVNYASPNVTSWTDIHTTAEQGRLVFMSDFPGDTKYRRTAVRGLVGWAPHWTVLCIAADDDCQSVPNGVGIDRAKAHLELCLKMNIPLAIVITKFDMFSHEILTKNLSRILSAIKATHRTPAVVPIDKSTDTNPDLSHIPPKEYEEPILKITDNLHKAQDFTSIVPIVVTSAKNGKGIRFLHALLKNLPIPQAPSAHDFLGPALNPEQPTSLFHIEDVFGIPASHEHLTFNHGPSDSGVVVAGHLRFGRLKIGDVVVVGPFKAETDEDDNTPSKSGARSSPSNFGVLQPQTSGTELARMASRNAVSASVTKGEWHSAHIVSLRNLRLPVFTLEAGQVGTIGVVFDLPDDEVGSENPFEQQTPRTTPRLRKGMVMAIPSKHMLQTGITLQAASRFTASFPKGSGITTVTPGNWVVAYMASVRASVKVIKLVPHSNNQLGLGISNEFSDNHTGGEVEEGIFGLDDEKETGGGDDGATDVTFELMRDREWIELGSQVLVMPGGGQGLYIGTERGEKGVAGLEGFVGRVEEVVD